jgi:hypothetical protein
MVRVLTMRAKRKTLMEQLGTVFLTWRRGLQKGYVPHGVTLKQSYVLRQLCSREYLHPSDIAEMLYCDRPTATVIIRNMERQGWVTREPDSVNRKRFRIRITCRPPNTGKYAGHIAGRSSDPAACFRRRNWTPESLLARLLSTSVRFQEKSPKSAAVQAVEGGRGCPGCLTQSILTDRRAEGRPRCRIDMAGVLSADLLPEALAVYRHVQAREAGLEARAVVVACPASATTAAARAGHAAGPVHAVRSRAFQQMNALRGSIGSFLQAWATPRRLPRLPIKPAAVKAGLPLRPPRRRGRAAPAGDVPASPRTPRWRARTNRCAPRPRPPDRRRCSRLRQGRSRRPTRWTGPNASPTGCGATTSPELRPHQENRMFGCGECPLACPRTRASHRAATTRCPSTRLKTARS